MNVIFYVFMAFFIVLEILAAVITPSRINLQAAGLSFFGLAILARAGVF